MSLTIIHGADGKILGAFRQTEEGKRATPVVPEGQHLLTFADEPEHLASLSVWEIGHTHSVDVSSGQLVRKGPVEA
jgi:hypothetical protein